MLNSDVLNQLAQLKSDIKASKEYAAGTVVGSNGRFGFVKLGDGRDAYLSPEKMQRLIPGDSVQVCLVKNDKGKLEAELEKLHTSGLDRFIGQYRIKGSAHFVQPSGSQSSRWIFLPPKARGKCIEGDYVVAKLVHHPFKDGKASAKVLDKIGQDSETKFELKYVKAKYELNLPESKAVLEQGAVIEKQFVHEAFGDRVDRCDLPFVTIDSSNTKDMDDALAIEPFDPATDSQIKLHVAIADPASFIGQDSALAKTSLKKGQTTYLLGGVAPMLLTNLSHHCFSLEAGKKRPALLCHIDIDISGRIINAEFEFAIVSSRHKLNYDDVGAFLSALEAPDTASEAELHSASDRVPEDAHAMLGHLLALSKIRREFRLKEALVSQDQNDYDYKLDDRGHIDSIALRHKTLAHQVVEEAMLATNICAGELLSQHQLGLCVAHEGFRSDRLGEVKALLREEEVKHGELQTLDGFIALIKQLEANQEKAHLLAPLRRMMGNAEPSVEHKPHLSMGLASYATITSPIRRFADLYNHWAIQKILTDKHVQNLHPKALEGLSEAQQQSRKADRELFQWLSTLYAQKLVGKQAQGQIRIVTQHGFGVRLDENGVEGFVLFGKDRKKKYDAKRMTIEVDEIRYAINSSVKIKVKSVDLDKRRIAFELAK